MAKTRRRTASVKLPIRQAHEIEATLHNVREFCGMHGASQELMAHIGACMKNITHAINERNRVVGILQSPERKLMNYVRRGGTNG